MHRESRDVMYIRMCVVCDVICIMYMQVSVVCDICIMYVMSQAVFTMLVTNL